MKIYSVMSAGFVVDVFEKESDAEALNSQEEHYYIIERISNAKGKYYNGNIDIESGEIQAIEETYSPHTQIDIPFEISNTQIAVSVFASSWEKAEIKIKHYWCFI